MPTRTLARAIMKRNLVTVGPDTPLAEAIRKLMKHQVSGLPVVDAEQHLLGIITEKDLLRLLYEERGLFTRVGEMMTTSVRTFQADDPLELVCDCLMANHFRRVPVLEGDRLVGLISRADLMGTILEQAAERVPEG